MANNGFTREICTQRDWRDFQHWEQRVIRGSQAPISESQAVSSRRQRKSIGQAQKEVANRGSRADVRAKAGRSQRAAKVYGRAVGKDDSSSRSRRDDHGQSMGANR